MTYTIYTDGSCLKNPGGPGGYAAVIFREGEMIQELSGGEALTTSNRMEIMAAIVGLRAVREPSVITLYSDSQYLIKTLTQGWKRMKTWTPGNGFGVIMVPLETNGPMRWRIAPPACTWLVGRRPSRVTSPRSAPRRPRGRASGRGLPGP
jgi:ribonuclease HI